jgi:hypothetical protein
MTAKPRFAASCLCGRVALEATGAPIVSNVCYCDDCQEGARRIEALPNAVAILDPDGGTAYLLFRKDRMVCSKGAALLKSYKLKETSATNRVVATCCKSAMFMNFDRGPYWVSAYRARFHGDLPPVEMRICTNSVSATPSSPVMRQTISAIRCDSWRGSSYREPPCCFDDSGCARSRDVIPPNGGLHANPHSGSMPVNGRVGICT